jgi:hypothetical protein
MDEITYYCPRCLPDRVPAHKWVCEDSADFRCACGGRVIEFHYNPTNPKGVEPA